MKYFVKSEVDVVVAAMKAGAAVTQVDGGMFVDISDEESPASFFEAFGKAMVMQLGPEPRATTFAALPEPPDGRGWVPVSECSKDEIDAAKAGHRHVTVIGRGDFIAIDNGDYRCGPKPPKPPTGQVPASHDPPSPGANPPSPATSHDPPSPGTNPPLPGASHSPPPSPVTDPPSTPGTEPSPSTPGKVPATSHDPPSTPDTGDQVPATSANPPQ